MSKVASRTKLVLTDYMEIYKPFISEGVVSLVGDDSTPQNVEGYWSNSVPHVRQCTAPYRI